METKVERVKTESTKERASEKASGEEDEQQEANEREPEQEEKQEEKPEKEGETTNSAKEEMTSGQKMVFRCAVHEKQNVMFTGAAGTGKSWVIRKIVEACKKGTVAITALTGKAAYHIGGCTLHSWAGLRTGEAEAADIVKWLRKKKADKYAAILKTKMLIIDEISMASAALFDKLDQVLRIIKKAPDTPMGGIRLLLTGDMMQLAPVSSKEAPASYVFQSDVWDKLELKYVELTENKRQEKMLLALCDALRFCTGRVGEMEAMLMDSLRRPLPVRRIGNTPLVPTKLFATNQEVDAENKQQSGLIKGKARVFTEYFTGENKELYKELQDEAPSPATLPLKIGSYVMYCINSPDHPWLVNGTQGVVVGWDGEGWPKVRFENGQTISIKSFRQRRPSINNPREDAATRDQLPLVLAWACTIHRSQGMSIKYLEVDLSRVFATGQAYVAVSRATTLEGLRIIGWRSARIRADPVALLWYRHTFRSPISSSSSSSLSAPLKTKTEAPATQQEEEEKIKQEGKEEANVCAKHILHPTAREANVCAKHILHPTAREAAIQAKTEANVCAEHILNPTAREAKTKVEKGVKREEKKGESEEEIEMLKGGKRVKVEPKPKEDGAKAKVNPKLRTKSPHKKDETVTDEEKKGEEERQEEEKAKDEEKENDEEEKDEEEKDKEEKEKDEEEKEKEDDEDSAQPGKKEKAKEQEAKEEKRWKTGGRKEEEEKSKTKIKAEAFTTRSTSKAAPKAKSKFKPRLQRMCGAHTITPREGSQSMCGAHTITPRKGSQPIPKAKSAATIKTQSRVARSAPTGEEENRFGYGQQTEQVGVGSSETGRKQKERSFQRSNEPPPLDIWQVLSKGGDSLRNFRSTSIYRQTLGTKRKRAPSFAGGHSQKSFLTSKKPRASDLLRGSSL